MFFEIYLVQENNSHFDNNLTNNSSFEIFNCELQEGYADIIDPFTSRIKLLENDSITTDFSLQNTVESANNNNETTPYYTEIKNDMGRDFTAQIFQTTNGWIVGLLLFSLIIIAWVRQFYNKYLIGTISGGYDYKIAYKQFHDKNSLSQRVSLALFAIFVINSGVYIFQMLKLYDVKLLETYSFFSLLIFSSIILALYLVKRITLGLIGTVTRTSDITDEYLHHIGLYNKILGLLLFPVIISIPFVPYDIAKILVKLTWFLWLIMFIMKIIRGTRIIMSKQFFVFYLILYFCALEILPVLIVYNFFISLI